MNKEEIYIEPPKTNYIVLTTHLDNLELARYIEKIPDTYFATFPYVKWYKQLQQENKQLKLELLEKKCSDKDIEYQEKLKLQKRIDEAIEYIENNLWLFFETRHDYLTVRDNLLEILRGESNEII